DEQRVGCEAGSLPTPAPRVLRHRRPFVLGDVAEAEGELALRAEALRAHLVGADARGDRELAAVDRLLHDRRREVDVAGREEDVRALTDQAQGARLRLRRVVVLRVAGLDHELVAARAALGVQLLGPDLRGSESGMVERGHLTRLVERPADHDRLLCARWRPPPAPSGDRPTLHTRSA